jgi:hypothetical protein
MLMRMRGERTLICGNINECSHYGKQYGVSFEKLKIELPYDFWAYI